MTFHNIVPETWLAVVLFMTISMGTMASAIFLIDHRSGSIYTVETTST